MTHGQRQERVRNISNRVSGFLSCNHLSFQVRVGVHFLAGSLVLDLLTYKKKIKKEIAGTDNRGDACPFFQESLLVLLRGNPPAVKSFKRWDALVRDFTTSYSKETDSTTR